MVPIGVMSALMFAGLVALALAMRRHFAQTFGPASLRHPWPGLLRLVGWLLLSAAAVAITSFEDLATSVLIYFGVLTITIGLVAMILAYLGERSHE